MTSTELALDHLLDPTPDLPAIEERARRLWDHHEVYRFDPAGAGDVFSVDTPPPYASAAHLHVGHAMSYAQAEFVVRYQRMRGKRVFYPMGFDDNGLPTERYVERKHDLRKGDISRARFRELCLDETRRVAAVYEELWRSLGLSVDWTHTYSTIDDRSRRTAQRSFLELHRAGRIVRSDEPVHWDTELGTALAQADLETIDRKAWLYDIAFCGPNGAELVISTTRPELLPACVALYRNDEDGRFRALAGAHARVPLFDFEVPVLTDADVDPSFGTGLMMVCTFGDSEDVRRWKRDSLPTRGCIDDHGRMTAAAGPYAGMSVALARESILEDLQRIGAIRGRRRIEQRVAVSDRSGTAVELVMRPQWFVRVLDLRDALLARADELQWHPQWMKQRLVDWVGGLRHDWNISRQRFYGVPFPAWFCRACGETVLAPEDSLPVDPLEDPPPAPACPACGGTQLEGDPDVMDTWMTSSNTPQILSNWASADFGNPIAGCPMTLRVQAHDIIRTWLFYTLVKAHLHEGTLPWRDVMVSGWGLNEQGKRISKRDLDPARPAGSYSRYDPADAIGRHGADALRHWAAHAHLGQDVRFSERDVRAGRKVVIKLWNAARFCAPHIGPPGEGAAGRATASDRNAIAVAPEDRWILQRVCDAVERATAAFDDFDYASAREAADALLWSFTDDWLELAKDRVWNPERHCAESLGSMAHTMRTSLRALVGLFAPFLPFVTEELYQRMFRGEGDPVSVHLTRWPEPPRREEPAPEMHVALAVLKAQRALRTSLQLSQTAEVDTLVIDAAEVPELVGGIAAIDATLRSAARARRVAHGEATFETAIPGLRIGLIIRGDGPAGP